MTQKNISPYVIPGIKNRYQDIGYNKFKELLRLVSDYYKVPVEDILKHNRKAPLPYIRMLIVYYIRKNYSMTSLTNIGKVMNGRDHTTIIHAIRQFQNKLDTDELTDKKLQSQYKTVREDYLYISKHLDLCL